MSPDQQLREHLERAAGSLQVDIDRQLDRIHHAVERRGRGRRVRALALAAVIGVVAVILVWQLRLVDEPPFPPAGSPTGRILYLGAQGSHRGVFGLDVVTGDVTALTDENRVRPVGCVVSGRVAARLHPGGTAVPATPSSSPTRTGATR